MGTRGDRRRPVRHRHLHALLAALVLLASSCEEGPFDPCSESQLPECPQACGAGAFERCGLPCAVEGEACGNEIGDGMTCSAGTWQCSIHPPLQPSCSRVCRARSR